MKTLINILLVITISLASIGLKAQDETAIVTATEEAQNLDLIAVMNLFKEASNLEEFEKLLNDPVKGINNLDLNHDKQADYIRVLETIDGNYRVIVLQSVIGQNDFQDVAVINVERTSQKDVKVVCHGNSDLYGDNYYIEPEQNVYVSVHTWPIWVSLFSPHYVYYHSPYYWNYYPHYYHNYYVISYYDYYDRVHTHYHNGYYHHHNQASFHPPHQIYKPQKSQNVVYNHNPNRPPSNGTNPRPGTGSNGVVTRPGAGTNGVSRSQSTTTSKTTTSRDENAKGNVQNTNRTYTRPTQSTTSSSRNNNVTHTKQYSNPQSTTRQQPTKTSTYEPRANNNNNTRNTPSVRKQQTTRSTTVERSKPTQAVRTPSTPAKRVETKKVNNTNQQSRQGGNSSQQRR